MPQPENADYLEGLDLDRSADDLENPLDPNNFNEDEANDSDKTTDEGTQEDSDESEADENKDPDSDDEDDDSDIDYKKKYDDEKLRNEKLSSKLKKGYKKHWEDKAKSLTRAEAKEMQLDFQTKMEKQREEEIELLEKFPEARKSMIATRKIANDKDIPLDVAYLMANKDKYLDPSYENTRKDWRTGIDWRFTTKQAKSKADQIFSKWPKFLENSKAKAK